MQQKRERIAWHPVWNNEFQSWSRGFLAQNKWRANRINDVDDLMQEAYLIFNNIAQTYPRVTEEGHFMALFKRAMINKMHDRSCHMKRRKDSVEDPELADIYDVFAGKAGETTNSGMLLSIINSAPKEVKVVIQLLAEGKLDAKPIRHTPLVEREHISTRALNALKALGFTNLKNDPISQLRQLLLR